MPDAALRQEAGLAGSMPPDGGADTDDPFDAAEPSERT
jgi:hypothetical protein